MTEALQDTMSRSASAYEKQIGDLPSERRERGFGEAEEAVGEDDGGFRRRWDLSQQGQLAVGLVVFWVGLP